MGSDHSLRMLTEREMRQVSAERGREAVSGLGVCCMLTAAKQVGPNQVSVRQVRGYDVRAILDVSVLLRIVGAVKSRIHLRRTNGMDENRQHWALNKK